ncbi:MAG: hypothetical protein U0174_04455 [Polyangiaceae bacterium]
MAERRRHALLFLTRTCATLALASCSLMCAQGVTNEVPHVAGGAATDPQRPPPPAPSGPPAPSTSGSTLAPDEGYEYVARSGKVSIALAEARGPERARVTQATDRALDKLVACMRSLSHESRELGPGAARVVLTLSEYGEVLGERVVAGKDSSYIVVRCLLPALKLQNYGTSKKPNDSRTIGLAFEAIWEF